MDKKYSILLPLFVLSLFIFTSCEFLGGIFKTGVSVGIFIGIIIIALIFIIGRMGRKNRL